MKRPRTTTQRDRFVEARLRKARGHERTARDARRRIARRRRMATGGGGLPVQRVNWRRVLDGMDRLVAGFHSGMAAALRRGAR